MSMRVTVTKMKIYDRPYKHSHSVTFGLPKTFSPA